jgi:MFS superfamily sulfate permease-like transporter
MSPNKKAALLLVLSFLVMLAVCAWIVIDKIYGPAVGAAAVTLAWIWIAMQIAKHADEENKRHRERKPQPGGGESEHAGDR